MSSVAQDIQRLRNEAGGLPHGATRIALLEEAILLADCHGDLDLGFSTRLDLVFAAACGGRGDLVLVAFSWCLAQQDRDPGRFRHHNLLWYFKSAVPNAVCVPTIDRQQIEALFGDMTERYRAAGSTLHAVYEYRTWVAMQMGDRDEMIRCRDILLATPRDWLSDCLACGADGQVQYLAYLQRNAEAVDAAAPILAGKLKCNTVPHRTYAHLLGPLLKLGRAEQAREYHLLGYRMLNKNTAGSLRNLAAHLSFLAVSHNLGRAVALLERHLPLALAAVDLDSRFTFYLAGRLVVERWMDRAAAPLRLRLPRGHPVHRTRTAPLAERLALWLDGELDDLARQFDERNGNDYFRRRIAELESWRDFSLPIPLEK